MLVDDHAMIREGLKQLLELDGEIQVVSEAGDGESCLRQLEVYKPDVLLLDINMPKMNGLEVLHKIREKKISVKTIVLTVHSEVEYLLKAIDIKAVRGIIYIYSAECIKFWTIRHVWPFLQA